MSDSGYWQTLDRFYSYDTWTFTKRELRASERSININGEIIIGSWTAERLQNEYEALRLIAARTTIPVPKIIRFERIWGTNQLVVERIHGIPLDKVKSNKARALANAEHFINSTVLPQLRSLKSSVSGSLVGIAIPPNRITAVHKCTEWPMKVAQNQIFNFCHNDLAQHNIMMNTDTLQVEAIIDWEFSGFYPPEFEAPLWTKSFDEPGYHDIDADKVESLTRFLTETGR